MVNANKMHVINTPINAKTPRTQRFAEKQGELEAFAGRIYRCGTPGSLRLCVSPV
jgi:hypothetical protein